MENEGLIKFLKRLKFYYDLVDKWGLGIGDWANPQIPNPQSPIPPRI